jgi:hypothetical protein
MHFFPGSGNNRKVALLLTYHQSNKKVQSHQETNPIRETRNCKMNRAGITKIETDNQPTNMERNGMRTMSREINNSHAESSLVLSKATGQSIHGWLKSITLGRACGGENKARGGWPVHLLYISSILGLIAVGS